MDDPDPKHNAHDPPCDAPSNLQKRSTLPAWFYWGAIMEMTFCFVFSVVLGLWLDRRFKMQPIFTLTCLFLGLIGSFALLLRMVHRLTQENNGHE